MERRVRAEVSPIPLYPIPYPLYRAEALNPLVLAIIQITVAHEVYTSCAPPRIAGHIASVSRHALNPVIHYHDYI